MRVPFILAEHSRTNADNRLSRVSIGRVEGGDGIIQGGDFADIRPQSSIPDSLSYLRKLDSISLDDEVNHQAILRSNIRWSDDCHKRSSGPDQRCGPLLDVATDDIEHQIDTADLF